MTCEHCKDKIQPVTIDESLSKMITVQAKEIHRLEAENKQLKKGKG